MYIMAPMSVTTGSLDDYALLIPILMQLLATRDCYV